MSEEIKEKEGVVLSSDIDDGISGVRDVLVGLLQDLSVLEEQVKADERGVTTDLLERRNGLLARLQSLGADLGNVSGDLASTRESYFKEGSDDSELIDPNEFLTSLRERIAEVRNGADFRKLMTYVDSIWEECECRELVVAYIDEHMVRLPDEERRPSEGLMMKYIYREGADIPLYFRVFRRMDLDCYGLSIPDAWRVFSSPNISEVTILKLRRAHKLFSKGGGEALIMSKNLRNVSSIQLNGRDLNEVVLSRLLNTLTSLRDIDLTFTPNGCDWEKDPWSLVLGHKIANNLRSLKIRKCVLEELAEDSDLVSAFNKASNLKHITIAADSDFDYELGYLEDLADSDIRLESFECIGYAPSGCLGVLLGSEVCEGLKGLTLIHTGVDSSSFDNAEFKLESLKVKGVKSDLLPVLLSLLDREAFCDLSIRECVFEENDFRLIAESGLRFKSLNLSRCSLRAKDLDLLIKSGVLDECENLVLDDNLLENEGLEILLNSELPLKRLSLRCTSINSVGASMLAKRGLQSLEILDLSENFIENDGFEDLMQSSALSSLVCLDLSMNPIDLGECGNFEFNLSCLEYLSMRYFSLPDSKDAQFFKVDFGDNLDVVCFCEREVGNRSYADVELITRRNVLMLGAENLDMTLKIAPGNSEVSRLYWNDQR